MDQAVEGQSPSTEIHPLLRDALAVASIYGVCGGGPSGPAPKFAGANFKCQGRYLKWPAKRDATQRRCDSE